ncbi:Calvin cycle protein CP12 [Gloeocapsa sp. PCC 73106]|uniref:Calvin cycle protein CP12 n=1 Tax=Gloeocapsa sp. PCC 73106 TaxID=102232 RepID=UPI0002AC413C|nr:Calvin cycle protein CP12 [Gloeocapsa sp. PCC 73106]ELR98504.1 CP12 domain protein [Gloeocapsa sp. PCC 73106]
MTNDIKKQIEQELEQAREVCSTSGSNSSDCAAAWDVVEELQAEASHQRQNQPIKTNFEKYCDANPDADECRLYDD